MIRIDLIRHAPALHEGRLCGRRDVEADCKDSAALGELARRIAATRPGAVWSSPARRCLQTCVALGLTPQARPDLWEQDFGEWEGLRHEALPDLGPLSPEALAAHRPPGGESFLDMAARVQPVLRSAKSPVLILAHAGTVRAALALVVGPAALSFAIDPLAITTLIRHGDVWSVERVNCQPGPAGS